MFSWYSFLFSAVGSKPAFEPQKKAWSITIAYSPI
jgi:hypothetical protein